MSYQRNLIQGLLIESYIEDQYNQEIQCTTVYGRTERQLKREASLQAIMQTTQLRLETKNAIFFKPNYYSNWRTLERKPFDGEKLG